MKSNSGNKLHLQQPNHRPSFLTLLHLEYQVTVKNWVCKSSSEQRLKYSIAIQTYEPHWRGLQEDSTDIPTRSPDGSTPAYSSLPETREAVRASRGEPEPRRQAQQPPGGHRRHGPSAGKWPRSTPAYETQEARSAPPSPAPPEAYVSRRR